MKNYEIWIRESLTGKEGLVEIRTQFNSPKKSSDGFYQHLKMKKLSPLNYPHPTLTFESTSVQAFFDHLEAT